MTYEWDESLETGHEKIDSQHRQLFLTLNSLVEAHEQGKDKDEIFKVLDFLSGYTIMHFTTEEVLQLQYDYPNYETHKQIHDDFKITVEELSKRIIDEGPTAEMIKLVTNTIGEWLVNHIQGDDFVMADYIKERDRN